MSLSSTKLVDIDLAKSPKTESKKYLDRAQTIMIMNVECTDIYRDYGEGEYPDSDEI